MRAGWNARLAERLQRPDPAARVIVEAVATEAEDVRLTQSDWAAAQITAGAVSRLNDGSVTLGRDAAAAIVANAISDGFTSDFQPDTDLFHVARLDWLPGNTHREISLVRLHLVAQLNPAQPQEVAWWKLTLRRLRGYRSIALDQQLDLQPIAPPVTVAASGGTAAGDVDFDFAALGIAPTVGDDPESADGAGSASGPVVLLMLEALKSDGSPAGNVGWASDSGQTEITNLPVTLTDYTLARGLGEAAGLYRPGLVGGSLPRCAVFSGTYAAATIGFSIAESRLELDVLTASTDIELAGAGETPGGSELTYEVSADAATWYEYSDGDRIGAGALAAVPRQAFYYLRATLTPGSGGTASPVLRMLGVRSIRSIDLDGVASVEVDGWSIDPITMAGRITEARISVVRDGPRDYRDLATETLSLYYAAELSFRVWVGHPDLDRADWLHIDSFLVDDYDSTGAAITFFCLSSLVVLSTALPVPDTSVPDNVTREPQRVGPTPIATAYATVLDAAGIAGRYLGPGIPATAVDSVEKEIEDSTAKAELDALAYLAGGGLHSSQGRIRFADMLGGRTPRAVFPSSEISVKQVTPGLRQRVPEFFVPHSWDGERYAQEARALHAPSLLNIGTLGLDAPPRLDDVVAQWIHTAELADDVGSRTVEVLGAGLMLWGYRSTYAHPYLEPGDAVLVETDQFVARDPNTGVALKGALWSLGVVQAVADPLGREFTVWVRGYADILPSVQAVARTGFLRSGVDYSILKVEKVEDTDTARTVDVYCGDRVDELGVFELLLNQPVAASVDAIANGTMRMPVVVQGGVARLTFERPAAGSELHVDLVALDENLEAKGGAWHILIDPVPPLVEGEMHATVENGAADLTLEVTGSASVWPVVAEVFEDSTAGAPLLAYTFSEAGQIDAVGFPALADRSLPLRAVRNWFARLVDVAGNVYWAKPATADRDPLPNGWPTPASQRTFPFIDVVYDDDVDTLRFTVPGGRTKTFAGLDGSGVLRYTVGDALDNATTENGLGVEEVRTPYTVEAQGGGEWRTIWTGPLVGPPRLRVVPRPSQLGATGTLTIELLGDTSRLTGVYFKSLAGAGDLNLSDPSDGTWTLDPTAPYATSVALVTDHPSVVGWAVGYMDGSGTTRYEKGAHSFTESSVAQVGNILISFTAVGLVVISASGNEDTANLYATIGIDSDPADPTGAVNDGAIAGSNGYVQSAVAAGLGKEVRVKVIGANAAGELGPVRSARVRRGEARQRPRGKVETTQSGSTLVLTGVWTDPTLSLTGLHYAIRDTPGADYGAYLNTGWSSTSGAVGAATTLTRTKNVPLVEGHTIGIKVRMQWTDETGATGEEVWEFSGDADQVADVGTPVIDFLAGDVGRVSDEGDEDTDAIYFTAAVDADPPDPTTASTTTFAARSGSVSTAVTCPPGSELRVKARGWNSVTGLGPVKAASRTNGDRLRVDAAITAQTGTQATITANALNGTTAAGVLEWRRDDTAWATDFDGDTLAEGSESLTVNRPEGAPLNYYFRAVLNGQYSAPQTVVVPALDVPRVEAKISALTATDASITAIAYNGTALEGTIEWRSDSTDWAGDWDADSANEGTETRAVARPEGAPINYYFRTLLAGQYSAPQTVVVPALDAPTKTPRVSSATVSQQLTGNCGTGQQLTNRITVSFLDIVAGYTWECVRYENGSAVTVVATGQALTTTYVDDAIDAEYDLLGTEVDISYSVQISGGSGVVDSAWTQTMNQPRTACP